MRKPSTDKVLEGLYRESANLNAEIERATLFAEGCKTDFWKAIRARCNDTLEELAQARAEYQKLTPDQRIAALEAERQIKTFLDIESYGKALQHLMSQRVRVQLQIRKIEGGADVRRRKR